MIICIVSLKDRRSPGGMLFGSAYKLYTGIHPVPLVGILLAVQGIEFDFEVRAVKIKSSPVRHILLGCRIGLEIISPVTARGDAHFKFPLVRHRKTGIGPDMKIIFVQEQWRIVDPFTLARVADLRQMLYFSCTKISLLPPDDRLPPKSASIPFSYFASTLNL